MSIEIELSRMHDRPAAFPETNCSHWWAKRLLRLLRLTLSAHVNPVDDLRCDDVSVRLRRSQSCEPANVYWKVDQIETSYYLLHSTYANCRHYLFHFVRFSRDETATDTMCEVRVCLADDTRRRIHFACLCFLRSHSTKRSCDRHHFHGCLLSAQPFFVTNVRNSRVLATVAVVSYVFAA